MKRWRYALRLGRLFWHTVLGILLTFLFAGLGRMSFDSRFYQRLVRWWLHKVVRIIGVEVKVIGQPAAQGVLMVANHISWLDIPVLASVANPRFLSKREVRDWPVIGWLAAKSGTLFITRGQSGAAAQAANAIAGALQSGRSVLLFPEGTTSDGKGMRAFHARLFAPAVDVGTSIQPLALRYPGADGQTNPLVPYVGNQSLWSNLRGLLGERQISAVVHCLPPMATAGMDRKALATRCEQQIRAAALPESAVTVVPG